jgi:hypothetical protein
MHGYADSHVEPAFGVLAAFLIEVIEHLSTARRSPSKLRAAFLVL